MGGMNSSLLAEGFGQDRKEASDSLDTCILFHHGTGLSERSYRSRDGTIRKKCFVRDRMGRTLPVQFDKRNGITRALTFL